MLFATNDECCPELEGKPRLFFIQACRGGEMDEGMGIKVLRRKKKKTTKDTTSGGNDQQDAQLYVSEESEDDDEFEEDDTSSVPNNEALAQHAKEENKLVSESKESGEVSQNPHPEQTVKSGEKGDPEDSKQDAAKDDGTGPESKAHPVHESSVQETQAPAEEAMAEEKSFIEEKTKGTPQVEPEVVYSRTTGERNTGHPVQETLPPGGEAKKEEKSSTEEQKSNEAVREEVVYSRIAMEKIMTISPPPIYKDFMLMYAAPPGFFAWRRDTGGWLIQMLVSVLQTADVTNVPLTRLLTTVSNRVSNEYESASRKANMNKKKLIPCVMSMLTKDVYFRGKHS